MKLANIINQLLHSDRLINSVKTALACLIGFSIARYTHFHVDQWLIITILVVMCAQVNVGGMLIKSYMRFLGTLTGSIIAILTLAIFGNDRSVIAIVIAFSAMGFSFIATSKKSYNDSGALGAVTVAIILMGAHPTIQSGIERCIEICLGILIAALVSQFIFPIHARDRLRRNQAATIHQLRDYYITMLMHKHLSNKNMIDADENIVKSLINQRKLADEARREKFGPAFHIDFFTHSLWCEKEILRSITFMHHAFLNIRSQQIVLQNNSLLQEFHQSTCQTLEKIALNIRQKNQAAEISLPNMMPLKNAFIQTDIVATRDERIQLDAFIFGAEVLLMRLAKLVELIFALDKR